ncbi:MAG: stalk domain-containing protein [Peptoniphilus sp.]|nr:stalk domain-containing protein [Peptoniphilus sp.]MDD7363213.1 stalk domain-containing protein [Bacillota bacterium]MDY6044463.1 stalk domain-containing protein [Peptoniphilus sp.]
MKRIILALFIVLTCSVAVTAAGKSACYLRGLPSEDGAVVIDEDVGYVSATFMKRAYHLDIHVEDNTVQIATASKMFRFPLRKEGTRVSLCGDEPSALMASGKLYLPVRAIAEALGDEVDWDEVNRTIVVQRPKDEDFNYYNKVFGFSLNGDVDLLDRVAMTPERGGIAVSIDGEDAGDILISAAPTLSTHEGFLLDYRRGTYYEYRRNADLDGSLSGELKDLLMTFKRQ